MSEIDRQRERYEAACRVPSKGVLRVKWTDGNKRLSGNGFMVAVAINNVDDAIDKIIEGEGRDSAFDQFNEDIDDLITHLQAFKKTVRQDIHLSESGDF